MTLKGQKGDFSDLIASQIFDIFSNISVSFSYIQLILGQVNHPNTVFKSAEKVPDPIRIPDFIGDFVRFRTPILKIHKKINVGAIVLKFEANLGKA